MTEYPKITRINARIDRVAEKKLEYIINHTDMNITEAMKESIDLLYHKVRKQHPHPYEIMQRLGLIGAFNGPSDLSENYKQYLDESLTAKHGYCR